MTTDSFSDYDLKRINDAIRELRLHFDCVHVFASRHDGQACTTQTMSSGDGNWFARYGQIKLFVNDVEKGYIINKAQSQDNF